MTDRDVEEGRESQRNSVKDFLLYQGSLCSLNSFNTTWTISDFKGAWKSIWIWRGFFKLLKYSLNFLLGAVYMSRASPANRADLSHENL